MKQRNLAKQQFDKVMSLLKDNKYKQLPITNTRTVTFMERKTRKKIQVCRRHYEMARMWKVLSKDTNALKQFINPEVSNGND